MMSAQVGRDAINATAAAIGMTSTAVTHKLACGDIANNPFNVTTMEDLALLYEQVATENDGLGPVTRAQFYANMLGGPNSALAVQIRSVIDQEAAALGMSGGDSDVGRDP